MKTMVVLLAISLMYSADVLIEDIDWHKYVQSGETNYEMKQNASKAIEQLNDRMLGLISELKYQDEEENKLFQINQACWNKYIVSKADYLADSYRTGSHHGLAYSYVMIDEYVKRIVEIKAMKNYKESP